MTIVSGIEDAAFLQAVATVLAGVVIFLTLETKFVSTTAHAEIDRGGEEQQKDENLNKRVE